MYIYSSFEYIHIGVKLPGHNANSILHLEKLPNCFPKVAAIFFYPSHQQNVLRLQFLHILTNTYYMIFYYSYHSGSK